MTMAFDCFLKIETIPGESTDDKHKDWIEVLSFSTGISQGSAGSRSTAGARSSGRADFADFTVVHSLDKASPKLALACAKGEHIKTVTMTLNRAGGNKEQYMEYKLEDVLVSSVNSNGSMQSGDTLPQEEISFNYGKMTWTYTETDKKTGAAKGKVSAAWSLIENKSV
jgi:type VI secretion system secreted protein Hcp